MKSDIYKERKESGDTPSPVSFLAPGMETRLSSALDKMGTRKRAAEIIGVSTDALQRWIRGENMPAFEAVVAICSSAGVRLDWLAFDKGPMLASETAQQSHSHAVRLDDMTMAIQLVEEALEGKFLPREKRAELFALVYDGLVEGLPEATVLRWARTAAK